MPQPNEAFSWSPLESPANSADVKTPIARAPMSTTGMTTASTRRRIRQRRLFSSAAASAVTGSMGQLLDANAALSSSGSMPSTRQPADVRSSATCTAPPSVGTRTRALASLRSRISVSPTTREAGTAAEEAASKVAAKRGVEMAWQLARHSSTSASGRAHARTKATATSSGDSEGIPVALGVGRCGGGRWRRGKEMGAPDAVPATSSDPVSGAISSEPPETRPRPATSTAAPRTVTARLRQDHSGHRHQPTSRKPLMTHPHLGRRPRPDDGAWRRFEGRRRSSRCRHRRTARWRRVRARRRGGVRDRPRL